MNIEDAILYLDQYDWQLDVTTLSSGNCANSISFSFD